MVVGDIPQAHSCVLILLSEEKRFSFLPIHSSGTSSTLLPLINKETLALTNRHKKRGIKGWQRVRLYFLSLSERRAVTSWNGGGSQRNEVLSTSMHQPLEKPHSCASDRTTHPVTPPKAMTSAQPRPHPHRQAQKGTRREREGLVKHSRVRAEGHKVRVASRFSGRITLRPRGRK